MALWKQSRNSIKKENITLGGGINQEFLPYYIDDSETDFGLNISPYNYPILQTSFLSDVVLASSDIGAGTQRFISIGEYDNENFIVHSFDKLQYLENGTTNLYTFSTTVSTNIANIQTYNTGSLKYSVIFDGAYKQYWDGSTSSTALQISDTNCPLSNIYTIHKNRIFVASERTIKYSALSNITDWSTPNDAGSIIISEAKTDITGIVTYNDKIVIFTEDGMFELYGDSPENFNLISLETNIGCISNRSIVKNNNNLYWAGFFGIYKYNGSSPIKISDKIKEFWDKQFTLGFESQRIKTQGFSKDEDVYMAFVYNNNGSTPTALINYNQKYDRWYMRTSYYQDSVQIKNDVYTIERAGEGDNLSRYIKKFDISTGIASVTGSTGQKWFYYTKTYNESADKGQCLSNVYLEYQYFNNGLSTALYSNIFRMYYTTELQANTTGSFDGVLSTTKLTLLADTSDFNLNGNINIKRIIIPSTILSNERRYKLFFYGNTGMKINKLEKWYRVKER